MAANKRRRKLNIKKLLILILLLYLTFSFGYYIYNKPIKNIIISGNVLVKDVEIIEAAQIKNYPSIYSITSKKIKNNIKKMALIEDVTVKKDLKFRLKIDVKERLIVFLNSNSNKLMLSNGIEIDNNKKYEGIPTLINYTPQDILKKFTISLGELDRGIIGLISEIEYSPKQNAEGLTIDESSFTLYMNDGNTVITNLEKCNNLSKYREIYASLKDRKGTLNLDSGNYENFVFIPY
ncbi:MAG: FtsQ-type POTRA domain-containing protein [Bacilli bacterium]|nr:FtsQ-type POTRA domain-containing protein [Bacilli bacterium]